MSLSVTNNKNPKQTTIKRKSDHKCLYVLQIY